MKVNLLLSLCIIFLASCNNSNDDVSLTSYENDILGEWYLHKKYVDTTLDMGICDSLSTIHFTVDSVWAISQHNVPGCNGPIISEQFTYDLFEQNGNLMLGLDGVSGVIVMKLNADTLQLGPFDLENGTYRYTHYLRP